MLPTETDIEPTETAVASGTARTRERQAVIDTDVHEMLASARDLLPHLGTQWHQYIEGGWAYPFFFSYGYPTAAGFARADAVPEVGPAGSDLELMREQLLDPYAVEAAILTSLFFPADMRVQREFGNALAHAYNDWLYENWLSQDSRLRGSICVNAGDPKAAAAEIDRVAQRPGYVQVILGPMDTGYGEDRFDPILEAAARNALHIGIHPSARALASTGYPEYLSEWRALGPAQHHQCQLVSLVYHGAFERYPSLRVTLIEGGWTWLPHILWRMDENYKALRSELPWLKKAPSEYVHEHVRFTTQPLEELTVEQFTQVVEHMGGEHLLLFSSDYPHWDFDSPLLGLPSGLSRETRQRICYSNAKEWYRL
jgi:predicted TIM-barrel fold metal-dependent hydrolase